MATYDVIKAYKDKDTGKVYFIGDKATYTDAVRAAELAGKGFLKGAPAPAAAPAPAKPAAKKPAAKKPSRPARSKKA